MKTQENIKENPDNPEPANERDNQMENLSDQLCSSHTVAVTKKYL
jgi:hypothetical protein